MDGFVFLLILAIGVIVLAIKSDKIFRRKRKRRKGKIKPRKKKNMQN